jgi:predicted DNA repair protein MutK
VTPILMIGGAYLCFEGFEKLAHKFLSSEAEEAVHREQLVQALADPSIDLLALEKDKIKGAVRTDFILSAEIIAITLGTVQNSPLATQVTVLSGIAVVMTAGVYGLVAGIVKLDDLGLHLSHQGGDGVAMRLQRSVGRGILKAAPYLMKGLSVAGTVAMFLVGGGILTHGIPAARHVIEQWSVGAGATMQPLIALTLDGVTGFVAGAVVLACVTGIKKLS